MSPTVVVVGGVLAASLVAADHLYHGARTNMALCTENDELT
jgi:hypothetical protein